MTERESIEILVTVRNGQVLNVASAKHNAKVWIVHWDTEGSDHDHPEYVEFDRDSSVHAAYVTGFPADDIAWYVGSDALMAIEAAERKWKWD